MMINVSMNISKGLDTFSDVEMQQRIDVNWLPSLRGSQPLTVLPLSTSTKTLRPSIFLPSACLYAAVREGSSHWSCPYLHPESAAYTYTRLKVTSLHKLTTYLHQTYILASASQSQTYSWISWQVFQQDKIWGFQTTPTNSRANGCYE